jgi:HK97 gp10 family phage protein
VSAARIDVFGIDEVIADLKKMDRACRRTSAKSAKKAADKLRDAIKDAAPVDSGDLKAAIKSQVKTFESGAVASAAVIVDAPGSHWIPVEFGHRKGIDGKPVPAHPFVYPTRDRMLPGLLDEIEDDMDSTIVATGGQ